MLVTFAVYGFMRCKKEANEESDDISGASASRKKKSEMKTSQTTRRRVKRGKAESRVESR